MLPNQNEYSGVTITITDTNAHRLLDLLRAVDPKVPAAAARVQIQVDDADGGDLLVGDANIALAPALRCAYRCRTGDSRPYESPNVSNFPLSNLFVRYTAGVNCVVNVEVQA